MRSGIRGIDHVIVAVRDLEAARANWSRLGFVLSPRGRHLGQGTANYCIMFAADYLELLGIVDPQDRVERLGAFLNRREGPMAVAFAPEGTAEEAYSALGRLGLHPADPRPLGRALELPEGPVTPRFGLVSLPPEETPGLDCFLCAHLTPELMRRPEWLDHPNGAVGIKAVHVLVAGTAELVSAYDRLFGLPGVTTTDAVLSIDFGRQRIVFSTADDFVTMHPGIALDPGFSLPGIASLELGIAARDKTARHFAQHGIPFAELPDGTLTLPASEADGAILLFSQSTATG